MWSLELVDTVTGGRVLPDLPSSSWSMRIGMNSQIGSGSVAIPTDAAEFDDLSVAQWSRLRKSWASTVVGKFNDQPVWAGIVGGTPSLSADGLLTLPLVEFGALAQRRLYFGAGLLGQSETFGPYSRLGMFNAIARHMCGGGAGVEPGGAISPWRLPVWTDAPQTGGWSWTTHQHEFLRPWEKLLEIAESGSGLDFVFTPGFWSGVAGGDTDRAFQWVLDVANRLDRSTREFELDAAQSDVTSWSLTWDAAEQQTGVFVLGEGTGEDRPVGMATPSDGLVMPAMDIAVSGPQQGDVASLNLAAEGLLASFRHPVRVWDLKVTPDAVMAGMRGGASDGLRLGSNVVVHLNHRVLGTVRDELLVTGMSFSSGSDEVSLEVQG